jgi:hypothetical protein
MRSVARYALASFLLLALAIMFTPASYAQISGTITGSVYDKTGAVVPNANVTLINQASADVRTTVSNGDGYFAFGSVQIGTYTVKVELKGFKTFQQKDIVLQASDKRNVNATLEIGQAAETITVEAQTDLTPVDSGARSLDLTDVDYARMPMITRNAAELLRTLPGVITVGNGTSNGASSSMDFSGVGAAGSSVGNGVSAAGVPYRGGTALLMDGTNILDEGCDCTSISVPNPDMVQEVKVQTSAFGADSSKGPVVINFLTKSGGATYHGEGYIYARNAIFNSDSWQNNQAGGKVATGDHYYYPGGNFGGPMPFTHKKLQLWGGYEHFYQLASGGTDLYSNVPTPAMVAGNFSDADANNHALCNAIATAANKPLFGADSTDPNAVGSFCYDPTTGKGPGGATIASAAAVPLDPGAVKLMGLMPVCPGSTGCVSPAITATNGGYDYFYPVPALHNGYVYRVRGDYSFSDSDKLFVTYQFSGDSQPGDGDSHMWWLPGNSVVFPGGGLTNFTQTKNVTGNFLHTFNPTLTNVVTAFWTYYNSPQSPGDFNAVTRGVVGYPATYGTIFNKALPLAQTMVPGWNAPTSTGAYGPLKGQATLPDFSQWDVFSGTGGSYFIRKENPAIGDDLTKVAGTHTMKFGMYYEMTGNNQANFNPINGGFSFNGFNANPGTTLDVVTGLAQGTLNPTADFMMGIASNYNEQSSLPLNDQAYKTLAFYGMDSWKMTKRFTADYGFRIEHMGHWYDRDGYGNAVWVPGDIVSDVNSGKVYPGVEWHAINPGIPLSGSTARIATVEPRVGIAYDIFGTGKTVVRGGFGMYTFNDQVNDYSGALSLAQQSIQTSLQGVLSSGTSLLFSETGLLPKPAAAFTSPSGGAGYITSANDHTIPWVRTWNFTIDQQTPWKTHVEVAYEGNSSGGLDFGGQTGGGGALGGADYINVNKVPLGGFFAPDPWTGSVATDPENVCGKYPDGSYVNGSATGCTAAGIADYHPFGTMNVGTSAVPKLVNVYGTNSIYVENHNGYSNYNALAVIWSKQTGHLNFNTSFLWSKSLGFSNTNINPFVLRDNYSILNIDRPYDWNTSYSYTFGKAYKGDNKVLGGVANNWTIAGYTTWQKGGDMQAQLGSWNFNMGTNYSFTDPTTGKTVSDQLSQRSFFGTDASMNIQPVTTCSPRSGLTSQQYVNLTCLSMPALPNGAPAEIADPYAAGGFLANTAKPYSLTANGPTQLPYIPMPSFFSSDLSVYKSFHITEKQTVEFRVTATNFLNHPLWGFNGSGPLSISYLLNPTNVGAGYTATSGSGVANIKDEPTSSAYGRVLQFGLKYSF